jgi:predicted TPR repeat methyltransferase
VRLALAAVAGSVLLLVAPLPPSLATPLRGAWVLLLAGIVAWQVVRLLLVQRHLLAAWLRLPSHRAPASYVRSLFDEYADRYDRHLLHDLHYAAPNLVRAIVGDRLDGRQGSVVVDLGCGTGICGPLFRRVAGRLIGVDLSPGMLRIARQREVYDELVEGEAVAFLDRHREAFDLLVAADVLVYVGDLAPLMRAAAGSLRQGGLMALTLEAGEGDAFELAGTGRFRHGEAYLARVVDEAGLRLLLTRQASIRRESGRPVAGLVALIARFSAGSCAESSQGTATRASNVA